MIHGRTSTSEWTGVLLSVLLKESGVQPKASWVVAEGGESNKYTMSIPLAKCLDDALVAWAQNGEPIRPHQGFPLRLIVPGWEAIRAVKWLNRIHVVDKPFATWHEAGNNADTAADAGKARRHEYEHGEQRQGRHRRRNRRRQPPDPVRHGRSFVGHKATLEG